MAAGRVMGAVAVQILMASGQSFRAKVLRM
jgi:hypothetical protein